MRVRSMVRVVVFVVTMLACLLWSCAPMRAEEMKTEAIAPVSNVVLAREPVLPDQPRTMIPTLGTRWHWHALLDREFASMPLSNTSCPGAGVRVPEGLPREGFTVWLLCFATPTPENSINIDEEVPPLVRLRPIEVVYTWKYRAETEPFPLEMVPTVPDQTGPWMSAVLVALPTGMGIAPYFNVQVRYFAEPDAYPTLWAAEPHRPARSVDRHGILRAWKLEADGRMTERTTRLIANGCVDELSPNFGLEYGASLLPDGERCRDELYLCAPGRFSCEFEP